MAVHTVKQVMFKSRLEETEATHGAQTIAGARCGPSAALGREGMAGAAASCSGCISEPSLCWWEWRHPGCLSAWCVQTKTCESGEEADRSFAGDSCYILRGDSSRPSSPQAPCVNDHHSQ